LISKELVKKNKGEIWAKSQIGSGSTFCFTLPKS
jgi:signal transduction histidine kinase